MQPDSLPGVHKGEFMGLPPTGKPITMTGIEIFRIENDKIVELWGEANLLGLMMQLGIIPAFGGSKLTLQKHW